MRRRKAEPIRPPGAPLRAAILIASLQQGGAERAVLGLLDGLLGAGVEAFLLCIDRDREMPMASDPDRARFLAGRVQSLSGSTIRAGTIAKSMAAPRHWWALQRSLRRLRPDVVLSFMERANILSLASPYASRIVLSVRSHPSRLFASKTALKRFLVVSAYRALLRRADRVVYVSKEAAADFERLFPEVAGKGRVIYNACDTRQARSAAGETTREEAVDSSDVPTVVSVGRLNPEKGHWHLLKAFHEICRRGVPARLVLIGRGPLEGDLRELRDRLGLADRVVFAGFQPNPLPWVARASVFVLPSLWEGFPNSLLEAMALGVPVIASDCRSGPREILSPAGDPLEKTDTIEFAPCGTLVATPRGERRRAFEPPTREEGLLADALERVLRDEGLRTAQAAAARARSGDFAPDRIVPEWVRLIEELRR